MTILDEYTRECLSITVARSITAREVIHTLADLFISRGTPEHIRSDNGPEFTAKAIREWLKGLGVKSLYIEPGNPWENGYIESFTGKLRDEVLNGEIFTTPLEARCLSTTGGGITTGLDLIGLWATGRQPQRPLCQV